MVEIIKAYVYIHGDVVLALIRVSIGIVLVLNEKYISRKIKYGIVVIYYGILLGCISIVGIHLSINSMFVGMGLGIIISCIIIKYHKTEHITNLILLFITFYEILETFFYCFKVNFSEIFKTFDDIYVDYKTIYVKIVCTIYVTLICYVILNSREKIKIIIEECKYFWLGIYFMLGAVFANTKYPLDLPDNWKDLFIPLFNVNYSPYAYGIPILLLLGTIIYRCYKRCS